MLSVRPYESSDLESLYAIVLSVGHAGGDARPLYADGRLIGHIYAAPYAVLEPRLALVVEDNEGVAGYAVGVADTQVWFERLEREWWPRLRPLYDDPGTEPSPDWTPDQRRAFMIHHPVPTPNGISERFPAHLHLNLSPRIQGRGVGRRLLNEWSAHAARQGIGAVHVGVNRANHRGIGFWSGNGFERLPDDASGGPVWMGRP